MERMRKIQILLAEDTPSHNKGESALLFGLIESFKCLPDFRVCLLSTEPTIDNDAYGAYVDVIDARGVMPAHMVSGRGSTLRKANNYLVFFGVHLLFLLLFLVLRRRVLRLFPKKLWQCYLDSDLIALGHDSSWAPLYHGTLLLFFRFIGKPTVVYAATIIPSHLDAKGFKVKLSNWLTKFAIHQANLVTLREKFSYEGLLRIGVDTSRTPLEVAPDLAFLVEPTSGDKVEELLRKEGVPEDRPLVGMAFSRRILRHAFPDEGGSDEERLDKGIRLIASLVDFLVEHHGVYIIFIPHSIGPQDNLDDRIIADRIIDLCKNKNMTKNIKSNLSSHDIKGIAGKLNISIGSRLHFIIDSISSFTPSLLFTYRNDIRCHGIVGDMLDMNQFVLDIEDIDLEKINKIASDLFINRDSIISRLTKEMPAIKTATKRHGELAVRLLASKPR